MFLVNFGNAMIQITSITSMDLILFCTKTLVYKILFGAFGLENYWGFLEQSCF